MMQIQVSDATAARLRAHAIGGMIAGERHGGTLLLERATIERLLRYPGESWDGIINYAMDIADAQLKGEWGL